MSPWIGAVPCRSWSLILGAFGCADLLQPRRLGTGMDRAPRCGGFAGMAGRIRAPAAVSVPRGGRCDLPIRNAVAVYLSEHRRIVGEDSRPFVHLQLLHRREDTGPGRLVLSVPLDPVLQLPALRSGAHGAGAGGPPRDRLQRRLLPADR